MGTRNDTPSRRALGRTPERVLVFLWGVGTHAGARAALADAHFTEADHREGERLLAAVHAWGTGGVNPADDLPAREATQEVAEWVRAHFPRFVMTMKHLHPAHAFVFEGGDALEPTAAVLALATLLERVKRLPDDVRDTLDRRGFDEAERQRLRELIQLAQSAVPGPKNASVRESREAELVALHTWYSDWAATARVYIRRKDYLIALGLAERKRNRDEENEGNE